MKCQRYVPLDRFPRSFQDDVEAYIAARCDPDPVNPIASTRPINKASADCARRRILRAANALVANGVPIDSIQQLRHLVTLDGFRRILQHCNNAAKGQPSYDNWNLAHLLRQIGNLWVKLSDSECARLKELQFGKNSKHSKLPDPRTIRNRYIQNLVARLDDAAIERLKAFPDEMWSEVKNSRRVNGHVLAKAQSALSVAILLQHALPLCKLAGLEFNRHVFIDVEQRSCVIRIPAAKIRGGQCIEYHALPALAGMIIDYHEHVVPRVMGHKPRYLFTRRDGTLKSTAQVRKLVEIYLMRRAGLTVTPAMFRRLAGVVILRHGGTPADVANALGYAKVETVLIMFKDVLREMVIEKHERYLMAEPSLHIENDEE